MKIIKYFKRFLAICLFLIVLPILIIEYVLFLITTTTSAFLGYLWNDNRKLKHEFETAFERGFYCKDNTYKFEGIIKFSKDEEHNI